MTAIAPRRSSLQTILLLSTALIGGGFAVATPGAVAAQQAVDPLEEIIVTSRKRAERLQEVPVAVTAFTESFIEGAGIEKPADFMALTPNVHMADAQDVGTVAITVRGIGQIRNGEAPVAIVVDGVMQSSPFQINQELVDIQQIEVLRGPQGALYGRNAIAGAINITTRRPGNEWDGAAQAGIGNGGQFKLNATASGPLIEDILAFRASASHREADGWIENTYLDEKVDFYETQSASLRLLFTPASALSFDLRVNHSTTEGGAAWYALASNAQREPGVTITDVANTVIPPTANNLGENDRTINEVALKADYDTDFGTFTSISSWSEVDLLVTFDGADYSDNSHCVGYAEPLFDVFPCADPNYFGFPFTTTFQDYQVRNWSQEFRFTSPSDRRLRYIVGAYYLNRHKDLVTATQEDLGFGIIPELDLDPNTPNSTRLYFAEENRDEAYAIFGQLAYDIMSDLELSVALRYDRDRRKQTDPRPDAQRLDALFRPLTGPRTRTATFDHLQPKATLSYKGLRDVTLYANYSQGFRSGGFNAPGTEFSSFTGERISDPIYDKETSENFEVGFKSQFLDRRLTVNAAAFYSKVDDLQVFNFDGSVNAQIVRPLDKVDIKGFELEANIVPVPGLMLFGSMGYTDAEIKQVASNPAAVGNQVPFNTKFSTVLGGQYRAQLSDDSALVFWVDWEHRGKTYFHEGGHPSGIPIRKPLDFVNARVTFELDERWSLTAWGRNLLDEEYFEEVIVADYSFQGRPRTYGVDLRVDF